MVVYYAKKQSLLRALKLQSADYVAMEVQSNQGLLSFLNDQTVFGLDQIVDATWSTRRTVTMRLDAMDGHMVKQKLVFDCQADLFYFLVELGMEPSQENGKVRRGSFSNPQRRKSYADHIIARHSARTSRAKSDFI
ncbi:hypothetical protein LEN26_011188 [Aphanomyces euteiches]|nr:hypothetical protein LEN26_011188 [Aphanomyces euteiches]KAH9126309.1 hypothetical protein AeMF1_003262 [Aphanomyces euteiches]KAH9193429.1 hypothetical protein AeNC1_004603 [Aphanomyces euteiches]